MIKIFRIGVLTLSLLFGISVWAQDSSEGESKSPNPPPPTVSTSAPSKGSEGSKDSEAPKGAEIPTPAKLQVINGKVQIPPTPSFDIVISKRFRDSARVQKLYKTLGVTGSPKVLHFVTNRRLAEAHHKDNIFYIQPRSFQGMLEYMSLAVEVPECLLQANIVEAPRYPDGTFFNRNEITNGILNIHMSATRPSNNANVVVYYRNHWYYIADNDLDSKRTFKVAQQIFNLQAGEIRKEEPVLTIPVR